jgi:two-component system, cell cycle sensor histidine kinase and response regulator CckA
MATILVVDDEAVVRGVARATLLRDGHTVLEAGSVSGGCSVGDGYTGHVDLLITDHMLSDGLGRQLAEHLLKTRPLLRVLHISGYPRQLILDDDSLTAGAAFLAKPFLPRTLSAAVNALLLPSTATGRREYVKPL